MATTEFVAMAGTGAPVKAGGTGGALWPVMVMPLIWQSSCDRVSVIAGAAVVATQVTDTGAARVRVNEVVPWMAERRTAAVGAAAKRTLAVVAAAELY